jgi:F-type H+-transporting ATPase subunit delta
MTGENSMKKSNRQYAKALYEATLGVKEQQLDEMLKKFAGILVRDRKLKQSEAIIAEFVKYSKKQDGVMEIKIKSARALSHATIGNIKKMLGEKIESVEEIDNSLLGGVVIESDDEILDASIKTQLVRLKEQMIN